MKIMPIDKIKTKAEARQIAIDYQHWANNQNLSYGELVEWATYLGAIGKKFNLTAEFKENGII